MHGQSYARKWCLCLGSILFEVAIAFWKMFDVSSVIKFSLLCQISLTYTQMSRRKCLLIIRTLLLPLSMDATNSIGCVNINGPVVGPSIASVVEKHVGATRKNSVQFIRKASRSNSIATEMSPDQIRAEARELVEVVREMTGVALPYIFYSLVSLSFEYVRICYFFRQDWVTWPHKLLPEQS